MNWTTERQLRFIFLFLVLTQAVPAVSVMVFFGSVSAWCRDLQLFKGELLTQSEGKLSSLVSLKTVAARQRTRARKKKKGPFFSHPEVIFSWSHRNNYSARWGYRQGRGHAEKHGFSILVVETTFSPPPLLTPPPILSALYHLTWLLFRRWTFVLHASLWIFCLIPVAGSLVLVRYRLKMGFRLPA